MTLLECFLKRQETLFESPLAIKEKNHGKNNRMTYEHIVTCS